MSALLWTRGPQRGLAAKAENLASCTASSATQCGSNPSLNAVSQKREFFTCLPETIGYPAPAMPKIGAWRLVANLQKPAIGGPFWGYYGRIL
jgi:hypothetical protein